MGVSYCKLQYTLHPKMKAAPLCCLIFCLVSLSKLAEGKALEKFGNIYDNETQRNDVCEDKQPKFCAKNKKKCKNSSVAKKCQKTCGKCEEEEAPPPGTSDWGCDVQSPRIECARTPEGACPVYCCENLTFKKTCFQSQGFMSLIQAIGIDDIIEIIEKNAGHIENNFDSIATNKKDIADIEDETDSNANKITKNKNDIAKVQTKANNNAKDIENNEDEISNNADEIENNENEITKNADDILELKSESKACPAITDENYAIIENRCFYFQFGFFKFDNAKAKCESESVNIPGKIYEPESLSTLQLVRDAYKEKRNKVGSNCFWMGIDDKKKEGKYVYHSDGSPVGPTVVSKIEVRNGCFGPQNPDGDNCDHVNTCEEATDLSTIDAGTANSRYGVVCEV